MKFADYYWEHPEMSRYVRNIDEGQYLFHQGESGTTMFVICRGVVELIAERRGQKHLIGIIESGQFLGEKAVISQSPHQRAFSARTKSDTMILELGLHAIEKIKKNAPELMNDLLKHMFQSAALRLDRANHLAVALRSSNPLERIVNLIDYYVQTPGRPSPRGTDFLLTPESIHYFIDISLPEIKICLGHLLKGNIIQNVSAEFFSTKEKENFAEIALKYLQSAQKRAA